MSSESTSTPDEHPSKPDDLSVIAYRPHPGRAVMGRLPPPLQMPLEDSPGNPEWGTS